MRHTCAFVASWRQTEGKRASATAPQRVAPKHAAILAAKPLDDLTPEQKTLFDRLVGGCPDLIPLRRQHRAAFRDI
ncbi:MAG: hypothetical protein OEV51_09655, partial [Nitrospira sp.]|nr:hypothetical protein [Nitrospira sp.]